MKQMCVVNFVMWVINCCVLTYVYIYITTNNNALHQHAENRLFLCHRDQGYKKPLNMPSCY